MTIFELLHRHKTTLLLWGFCWLVGVGGLFEQLGHHQLISSQPDRQITLEVECNLDKNFGDERKCIFINSFYSTLIFFKI